MTDKAASNASHNPNWLAEYAQENWKPVYVRIITKLNNSLISSRTWTYCPGHAGVRDNEIAYHLVGRAAALQQLELGKGSHNKSHHVQDVRPRRHWLWCQQAHQYVLEMGEMKGSSRQPELGGRDNVVHSQCVIGTASKHMLKTMLKSMVEHLECPECKEAHHLFSRRVRPLYKFKFKHHFEFTNKENQGCWTTMFQTIFYNTMDLEEAKHWDSTKSKHWTKPTQKKLYVSDKYFGCIGYNLGCNLCVLNVTNVYKAAPEGVVSGIRCRVWPTWRIQNNKNTGHENALGWSTGEKIKSLNCVMIESNTLQRTKMVRACIVFLPGHGHYKTVLMSTQSYKNG